MYIAMVIRQKVVLSINGNSVPCWRERICCALYYATLLVYIEYNYVILLRLVK